MVKSDSTEILWESPPPRRNGDSTDWYPTAEALRGKPGEWALLKTFTKPGDAGQFASNVRRGIISAFRPQGQFEATSRDTKVWVRYIGEVTS